MEVTDPLLSAKSQQLHESARAMALACDQLSRGMVKTVPWKDVWCCKGPVENALQEFRIHLGAVTSIARALLDGGWRDEFRINCRALENDVKRWLRAAEAAQHFQREYASNCPDEFALKTTDACSDLTAIGIKDEVYERAQGWAASIRDECIALAERMRSSDDPALLIDAKLRQVTADGKTYKVGPKAVIMLDALVKANGDWVSKWLQKGISKPSGVRANLPKRLRDKIQTESGKGYRILKKPRKK